MRTITGTEDESWGFTSPQAEADRRKIEDTLRAYETALNASDVDSAVKLFTSDGIFMAPNNPAAEGAEAIDAAYRSIFQAIAFDTELHVQEIIQVAADWAFVRTNSKGSVTVQANGARVPDANHELFVFQRTGDGEWKIARYCFSTTLPRQ